MKRYFAMLLAVVLLCICTGAMAMGWGRADNPPPTYTVTITKLDKVATTSGAAYTPAPGKAATVGTVVYFTAKFADAEGNPVQGTINLTDMDVLYLDGNVVAAIVTGAYPAVRAVYKYTTPLAELTYDGKPVTISGDTVTIGSLTFIRRNGVAVDVSIAGGLADLTRELFQSTLPTRGSDAKKCIYMQHFREFAEYYPLRHGDARCIAPQDCIIQAFFRCEEAVFLCTLMLRTKE